MAAVDLRLLQGGHRLVVHLDVLLAVLHGRHRRRRRRPPQRFVPPDRASRRQWLRDIDGAAVGGDFGRLNLAGARPLARIAHLVVVRLVQLILAVLLPLAARRREEALLALAAAAHTRRVVRVVDGPQVAAHLAAATRYACLVCARVRLALPLSLSWAWRRCVGRARHVCAGTPTLCSRGFGYVRFPAGCKASSNLIWGYRCAVRNSGREESGVACGGRSSRPPRVPILQSALFCCARVWLTLVKDDQS